MNKFFKNKSILVTGGTGSFGQKFTEIVLKRFPHIKKIIIFRRDEFKQFEMQKKFCKLDKKKKLRFFLGDIRDLRRFKIALNIARLKLSKLYIDYFWLLFFALNYY